MSEPLSAGSTAEPAPAEHRSTALDPELAAYLDWPLYFLDSSAPYCNKFPACTNPECCDPCSGSVPIASARRMTVREFLADIKAHAEGQP